MDVNKYIDDVNKAYDNVYAVVNDGKINSSTIKFKNSDHVFKRQPRLKEIIKQIGGVGKNILAVYFVDKNHPAGPELHWITDNSVIITTNALNQNGIRICTFFAARVGQLTRYPHGGMRDWDACE